MSSQFFPQTRKGRDFRHFGPIFADSGTVASRRGNLRGVPDEDLGEVETTRVNGLWHFWGDVCLRGACKKKQGLD